VAGRSSPLQRVRRREVEGCRGCELLDRARDAGVSAYHALSLTLELDSRTIATSTVVRSRTPIAAFVARLIPILRTVNPQATQATLDSGR
jgi:hypothetical protein